MDDGIAAFAVCQSPIKTAPASAAIAMENYQTDLRRRATTSPAKPSPISPKVNGSGTLVVLLVVTLTLKLSMAQDSSLMSQAVGLNIDQYASDGKTVSPFMPQ